MIYIEKSTTGRNFALGFILLAGLVFAAHLYGMKTGTAQSGESALWFSLFTLPWGGMFSKSFLESALWLRFAYPLSWSLVLLNALILYLISGGLRIKRGF